MAIEMGIFLINDKNRENQFSVYFVGINLIPEKQLYKQHETTEKKYQGFYKTCIKRQVNKFSKQ